MDEEKGRAGNFSEFIKLDILRYQADAFGHLGKLNKKCEWINNNNVLLAIEKFDIAETERT